MGGMTMIDEKATDLGRLIGQSNEYQAMRRADDSAGDLSAIGNQDLRKGFSRHK